MQDWLCGFVSDNEVKSNMKNIYVIVAKFV